jgi:TolB-like protein
MAVVYLGRDLKHERPVAIKVLRPEIVAGLGPDRFLLEIQIAATLQHPHIVGLIDSGVTSEALPRPFYVMPFVEGETLRQRLAREGQLPVSDALRLVREVGEALGYAHELGLIHRDVKPENVLLSRGHAVVADFGIARAVRVAAGDRLTETGLSLGTPAYMSPEQAGGGRDVDARSDQYSLACVLYELLGGQPPFTGQNAGVVLSRHVLDPVPPLATLRSAVPAPVRTAIERALAKVSADRFANVAEFLAALEAPEVPAAPEKSIVVLPFANLSPDADNEYIGDGLTEELIADLSKVRELRVIARNSAMRLKGTNLDAPALRRELRVRYVLAGSVRRAGNNLRITAQLSDAIDDRQIWAEKYQGTVEDIFDVQERLSRQIVDALRVTISPPESQELAARPHSDFAAFECYQRIRHELYKFTADSAERAVRLAREGLKTLGESELLLAALAHGLAALEWVAARPGLADAEQVLARLFARWPTSPYGHLLNGIIQYRRGNIRGSVDALNRARSVLPSDSDVSVYLSVGYALAGRFELGRAAAAPVTEIDPLFPIGWNMVAICGLFGGNLEEGLMAARRGADVEVDGTICRTFLALGLMIAGKDAEAGRLLEDADRRIPGDNFIKLPRLVWRARRGEIRDVKSEFTPEVLELARADESATYMVAAAYALAGDRDEAIRWFEHMMRDRGFIAYPYFAHRDPFLVNLRDDPRYQALLLEMKAAYDAFDR